jgi:hypothetical protein
VAGREHLANVTWTKAHVTAQMQERMQVPQRVLSGNECADALAKRGSKLAGLELEVLSRVQRADDKAQLVRNRLLCIQMHILKTQGVERTGADEERRQQVKTTRAEANRAKRARDEQDLRDDLVAAQTLQPQRVHQEEVVQEQEELEVAEQASNKRTREEMERPSQEAQRRARQVLEEKLEAVRVTLHSTHVIEGNRDIVWCARCGCYKGLETAATKLLKEECKKATRRGKENLGLIGKGRHPRSKEVLQTV